MVRDTVRSWVGERFMPVIMEHWENGTFPMEMTSELAELGVFGPTIPEEYGGAGMNSVTYGLICQELERGDSGLRSFCSVQGSLVMWPINEYGSEEQKREYLPKLASGEMIGSFGLTEPDFGSNPGGMLTTARKEGDEYVLNGRKCFITNANHAGVFIVTAVTDRSLGSKGISAFVVPRDIDGFTLEPGETKLGMRGSDWASLVFQDARIPRSHLLGPAGEGFATFMKTLEGGRISIGALSLGLAEGAFDCASRYALEREAFGGTLADQQAVQFKLADMRVQIEAARHLVYHAARLKDSGQSYGTEASIGKLYASEIAMKCTYEAIQIYGGYGYSREYPVERMWRDAKLCTIGEGTSEIQRLIIGRAVLKAARSL